MLNSQKELTQAEVSNNSMTLEELKEIRYIKSEIEVLKKRLQKCKNNFVGDYAKDYSSGQERIITIQGYTINTDKIDRITSLLAKRKAELEEKVLQAELFINSIPDSKIRTLLTLRYIEGWEWSSVAKALYKKMTGDSARKAVVSYFEKIS